MRRWGRFLEVLAVSSALFAGPPAAFLLALAEYARLGSLLAAGSVALAGHFLRRLAERRNRNAEMRPIHREIGNERRFGRLCVAVGVALALLALILPPWIAVAAGWTGAVLVALRGLAIMGDSANREQDLSIGNLSPAAECPHIEIWARRVAALPGKLPDRIGRTANHVPGPGKIRGARLAALALAGGAVLTNVGIGAALVYKEGQVSDQSRTVQRSEESTSEPPAQRIESDSSPSAESDRTYEDECPELPDPLEIGYGLGQLFRFEGAFKAGCGNRAQQVIETGARFSRGICDGRLRSLAVAGPDGNKAIVYGAAAEFALRSAQAGELVSAEGARPAGGEVFIIETLAGSYGFSRQGTTSEGDEGRVSDCTDVSGTSRPFAELFPPMMLLWRDLIEQRGEWSWPLLGDGKNNLAFAVRSTEVAAGRCDTEFSCYLLVEKVRWPGVGTAYVSLDELREYMPPLAPYPGT